MFLPRLNCLEERFLPSITAVFDGQVLSLAARNDSPLHQVLIRPAQAAGGIEVIADGVISTYSLPARINYADTDNNSQLTNRTAIGGSYTLGDGSHIINTTAANSTIAAGDGNNFIQALAGNNLLTAGNGNNNIYGGPGDRIFVGSGQNIVYDILPGNQVITVAPHPGNVNYLFVGPQTTLIGAESQDQVARFFATGRGIGSGTLVLDSGTLYFTASHAGDTYVAQDFGGQIQVTTISNGVLDVRYFQRGDVRLIANFGGSGRDVFLNNTSIPDVQYGAGGTNVLVGGMGPLNLLKAGGAAGNSSAFGRSPLYNDLNGSGTLGVTSVLVGNAGSRNVFRTNSPTDVLVPRQRDEVLISLFPDLLSP